MVTRIRPAVAGDAADILTLVHRFLVGTRYVKVLPYAPDALATLLGLILEGVAPGIVYVGEERRGGCDDWLAGETDHCRRCRGPKFSHYRAVALIAGIAGKNPVTGEGMVEELVWWVNPEARGTSLGPKMLRSLEVWARQNGYLMLKMVAPVEVEPGSNAQSCPVGDFYERLGYTPLETVYFKRL